MINTARPSASAASSRPSPISTSTTGAAAGSATSTGNPVAFQEIQPESNQLIPRILFAAEIRRDGRPPVPGPRRSGPARGDRPRRSSSAAPGDAVERPRRPSRSRGGGIARHSPRRNRASRTRRHRPSPAPRHHRHLDLPHRPLGGAGRGDARRRVVARRGDRSPARPRPPRWPSPQLARPPGRSASTAASPRVAHGTRGQFRRALHACSRCRSISPPCRLAGPTASPAARSIARPSRSRMAVPRLVAAAHRAARHRARHQRRLQPQRRRSCLAADPVAQPARWRGAAAGQRPTPGATSTPTRVSTALPSHFLLGDDLAKRRPDRGGAPAGAAARRLRSLRGHEPAGLGTGAAARPLGPGDAAQRRRRVGSPILAPAVTGGLFKRPASRLRRLTEAHRWRSHPHNASHASRGDSKSSSSGPSRRAIPLDRWTFNGTPISLGDRLADA